MKDLLIAPVKHLLLFRYSLIEVREINVSSFPPLSLILTSGCTIQKIETITSCTRIFKTKQASIFLHCQPLLPESPQILNQEPPLKVQPKLQTARKIQKTRISAPSVTPVASN